MRQEQADFRQGRSCNDQIFTLRQILEKVTAWKKPVMMNSVDFRKAFDCIHQPSLWKSLKSGIPDNIIAIIQNMYDDSQNAVKWLGTIGQWVLGDYWSGLRLYPLSFAICAGSGLGHEKVLEWT